MSDAVLEPPETGPLPDDAPPDRTGSVISLSRRGFHRIAYVEFGDPASDRVALCVHGLSRQGRDFDRLARALAAKGWRVICPDLAGRGHSEWLKDPEEYNLPQYAMDMAVLIARLGVAKVDWIGTSLGGLTGMVLAGQHGAPIQRLVVNDIGPFLPWQALHRIADSVRASPRVFPDFTAALTYFRTTLAPFGDLSEAEWRHLTVYSIEQLPNGTWRKLADPGIIAAFKPGWFFNLSLWSYWDAITCPAFVLRGVDSDLLLAATTAEMRRRGPPTTVADVPGCGHAPALLEPSQIALIVDWLEATPPGSANTG